MLADIPGLIEGAHAGAGLGTRFLGHVERCRVLIHLVDGTADDPAAAWRIVRDELAAYGDGLADKPEIVALNKIDALADDVVARTPRRRSPPPPARPGVRRLRRHRRRRSSRCSRRCSPASMRSAPRPPTATAWEPRPMSPFRQSSELALSRRLVVKIGSALLVDEASGDIRRDWLAALADDIAALKTRRPRRPRRLLRRHRRRPPPSAASPPGHLRLDEKQAAAATGMIRLAHAYQEALARFDITVAQVLLTLDDTRSAAATSTPARTLTTLLRRGAVPLINENDTVATDEIRFGDNDRLGARVAAMVSADTLVLLSDIDGLYTADPRKDEAARLVPRGARDHARDRGDGGHDAPRLRHRRHDHQAGGGADRARCRLPDGDRRRRRPASARPHRRRRHAAPGSCRRNRPAPPASAGSPAP